MENLLSLNFWFNLRPGALILLAEKFLLIFVIALVFFTIVFGYAKTLKKKGLYAKFWESLYYFSLTNSVIGLLFMFFNYEMIPFLTARFWYLLWSIVLVIWLFYIVKATMKIPKKRQQLEEEKKFKQYVP